MTGCEPCRSAILMRLLSTAARLKLIFHLKLKLNLSVSIFILKIIIRSAIWTIILVYKKLNII